ncbi:MAG: hypothetical protein M3Z25_05410 [Actinomycetota bacterium]|nr:hypothetical protein [Actinomycetota bacterium]
MFERFKINVWAHARAGFPVRYYLAGEGGGAVFVFGNEDLELSFEAGALRHFVKLGTEALQEMDTNASDDPSVTRRPSPAASVPSLDRVSLSQLTLRVPLDLTPAHDHQDERVLPVEIGKP